MLHDESFEAFHGYWSQCDRAVVIQTSWIWFLRQRYYGGALETGGYSGLTEGKVEYVCENIL